MTKILQLILIIGLYSTCRQTTDKVVASERPDTLVASPQDDYLTSTIYRALDSDSLVIDKGAFDSLVSLFKRGHQLSKHDYGGGDCYGAYRTFKMEGDSSILTVDKYDCGDYGFGNNQYLTRNANILLVREFKVEWDNVDNYHVTERIIEFKTEGTIIKARKRTVSQLVDLRFKGEEFEYERSTTDEELERIKKELIDKGRLEQ